MIWTFMVWIEASQFEMGLELDDQRKTSTIYF